MNVEAWRTWEGRVVDGKFPLRQWLGGSDHSAVFLTERPGQASQKVAIKLISADADAVPHLARWRTAAQLSHPHLIRIYETGRYQMNSTPLLYLVMEWAEEDLSQILPLRPLAPGEVTELLPPLLDALSYLHGKGAVHGRIKPSNVLAVGDLLKLSSDQAAKVTQSGAAGKRRDVYDAPETAAGIVSPAGDLWSVGATLVAALTQNAPFADEASEKDPGVPGTIPEPFRGIARECLHLDPKRRCSIAEIQARLQPAGRSVGAEPEAPPPPPSRVKRGPVVAAVLVAAVVVGVVIFHSRGKNATAPITSVTEQPAPQAAPAPASTPATAIRTPEPEKKVAEVRTPAPPAHEPAHPAQKAAASQGEVLKQVLPTVPQSARSTITGTIKVSVRVDVDSSGKVTAAKIASAGPSQYFANLALKAAQSWEFSPPAANGQPAASTWLLRFRFKRASTQASPERVTH